MELKIKDVKPGDEIRVRNRRMSASGTVAKVNRVNLIIESSVFGHPVTYTLRKDDLIGEQVGNDEGVFTVVE